MLLGVGLYINDYNRASNEPTVQQQTDAAIPNDLLVSYSEYTGISQDDPEFLKAFGTIAAQGALSIFVSHCAFLLLLFLEPPHKFFTGWRNEISEDKRPALLALGLIFVFQVVCWVPAIGTYFGILEKPLPIYLLILAFVAVWFFAIREIWRRNLFDRFLGLPSTK